MNRQKAGSRTGSGRWESAGIGKRLRRRAGLTASGSGWSSRACIAPKAWLNGVLVAEKLNGYVSFCCDITPHLKPAGQTNIIAVRADNSLPETSRWYTGGGIYRHVWLHVVGDVHVVLDGIYVTTPKITADQAWVNAQTEVRNPAPPTAGRR